MNPTNSVVIMALAAILAFGQDSPRPAFDVASIRPSSQGSVTEAGAGLRIDGAQVRGANLTFKDYLVIAYGVKAYQISGPDWIGSERFDIAATLPGGAPARMADMMQTLLEERFDLKLHREKKDFPAYVLLTAKGGLKITADATDPNLETANTAVTVAGTGSSQGVTMRFGAGSSYVFAANSFQAKRLTMANLAASLERFVDRPVIDTTGLNGSYTFILDLEPEDYRAMLMRAALAAGYALPPEALRAIESGSLGSLMNSLQKLGLSLDSRKSPLDLLIIDQARKTPTEN